MLMTTEYVYHSRKKVTCDLHFHKTVTHVMCTDYFTWECHKKGQGQMAAMRTNEWNCAHFTSLSH